MISNRQPSMIKPERPKASSNRSRPFSGPNRPIAQITTNLGRVGPPTRLLINIADETASGLLSDSVVMCDNLYTVHNTRIIRTLGSLSTAAIAQIDRCLKAAHGIP